MHAEYAAFLRAIRAAPDDDLPRLIYADFLDERGNPRGQFIRMQVELERPDLPPRRARELRRDAGRLHAEFRVAWAGDLAEIAHDFKFRRGFVDEIDVGAAAFLRH